MKTYTDALNTIYSTIKRSITLDKERPDRVREILALTGNPHVALPTIHVTGTKGKGSTCAMIAAALQSNGYRVGLYTSPHLHTLRERIQIDFIPISSSDLIRLVEKLKPHLDNVPDAGFPEVMTCLALHYFAEQKVDVAVIEVHLGGRYDATNVITPLVSVITTIDYDHMDILGFTLPEIAAQKAGIIKPEIPVVVAPQSDLVKSVLSIEAHKLDAPLHQLEIDDAINPVSERSVPIALLPPNRDGQSVRIENEVYHTNLIGVHQGINLAVAVSALKQLTNFRTDKMQVGLNQVGWGGRLEVVHNNPVILLDIAHNHAAALSLRQNLDMIFTDLPRVFVYGSKANKDVRAILRDLMRPDDHVIFTQVDNPPTSAPDELERIAQEIFSDDSPVLYREPTIADALVRARELAGSSGMICVTGSIFVVSAVRALVLNIPAEDGSAR